MIRKGKCPAHRVKSVRNVRQNTVRHRNTVRVRCAGAFLFVKIRSESEESDILPGITAALLRDSLHAT